MIFFKKKHVQFHTSQMMTRIIKYVTSLNENMLQVNWLKIVRALFLQCISALPKKKCCWKRINLLVITILVYFCLKMFSLMYVSYPRFTLLCGPSGFAPSQKQSRGVIMTQGRSCWIIYKRQGLFVKKCVEKQEGFPHLQKKKKNYGSKILYSNHRVC